MPQVPPRAALLTHEVTNQPEARAQEDLWADDPALRTHAAAVGADAAHLARYGATMGGPAMQDAARATRDHPPEPHLFDTEGRRLDEVRHPPGYHAILREALGAGFAALPWEGDAGGHATHAGMVYMTDQLAPGLRAPLTTTYAAIPALKHEPALFDRWVPKLMSRAYDGSVQPLARKTGALLGLAVTEKQGGSDVEATATRAAPDGEDYVLRGHKWFCAAPMSDGIVTLAQAPGGLTCFVVPRWMEGARNAVQIQRLKTTLADGAAAVAEIELLDARAQRLGPEGQGARILRDMVHHMRLDAALQPAGVMRAALVRAVHRARHRAVSGKALIAQPLMRAVLADLVLDWEGTLALGLHVAQAHDAQAHDAQVRGGRGASGPGGSGQDGAGRAYARLAAALAAYMGNKLCPVVVCEAMEAMGGTGQVEDSGLPPLYRAAPLAATWDGTGNLLCLDVLRILRSAPGAGDRLGEELGAVAGRYRRYDDALNRHIRRFPRLPEEAGARWYAESLATLLTASVLIRQAPPEVAEGFVATRLTGERGRSAGAIGEVDRAALLARLGPDA